MNIRVLVEEDYPELMARATYQPYWKLESFTQPSELLPSSFYLSGYAHGDDHEGNGYRYQPEAGWIVNVESVSDLFEMVTSGRCLVRVGDVLRLDNLKDYG